MKRLSEKQEEFCQKFIELKNGTRAAIAAGYSESGARVEACRMLTNPNIIKRIKEIRIEAMEKCGYNPEELRMDAMRNLYAIAKTDIADIAQVVYENDTRRKAAVELMAEANNGQYLLDFGDALVYIKPTSEWTPEERTSVKSIKMGKGGIEIEQYDKLTAYKLILDVDKTTDVNINFSPNSILDILNERRADGVAYDASAGMRASQNERK